MDSLINLALAIVTSFIFYFLLPIWRPAAMRKMNGWEKLFLLSLMIFGFYVFFWFILIVIILVTSGPLGSIN